MKKRKLQIGVFGSAADLIKDTKLTKLAEEIGYWIAKKNATFVFGAEKDGDSLPTAACRGVKKAGGFAVGITYGKGMNVYDSNTDVIVATGLERGGGREFVLALSCDVVIAINGGSGTLNEMVVAYQAGIPIVTINGTGGWSEKLSGTFIDSREKIKVIATASAKDAVITAISLGRETYETV